MEHDMTECARVVEKLKDRDLPHDLTLDDIKRVEGRTAVESILIIKSLLDEFSVSGNPIIEACGEAKIKDSVDWAICSHMAAIYGNIDREYALATVDMFNHVLRQCKGFRTDWKFYDPDLAKILSRALEKYQLKVTIDYRGWMIPFELALHDLRSGRIIDKTLFSYKQNSHDMHDLIDAVNKMVKSHGLVFVDGDEGADSYVFILLEIPELERLNSKYGDVGYLINSNKHIDRVKVSRVQIDENNKKTLASLFMMGMEHYLSDDPDGAMKFFNEEERICRELGYKERLQGVLSIMAHVLMDKGDTAHAMELLKEQESLCRDLGLYELLLASLDHQAKILKEWGDLDNALKRFREKERISRWIGDKKSLASALLDQSVILSELHRSAEALSIIEEAFKAAREVSDKALIERAQSITKQIQRS